MTYQIQDEATNEILAIVTDESIAGWWMANEESYFGVSVRDCVITVALVA